MQKSHLNSNAVAFLNIENIIWNIISSKNINTRISHENSFITNEVLIFFWFRLPLTVDIHLWMFKAGVILSLKKTSLVPASHFSGWCGRIFLWSHDGEMLCRYRGSPNNSDVGVQEIMGIYQWRRALWQPLAPSLSQLPQQNSKWTKSSEDSARHATDSTPFQLYPA